MAKFNTYLNFNGNTEEAFNFYRSIFGGEFAGIMRWKDMPADCGGGQLSEDDQDKIMHMALPLGDGQLLMGTDALKNAGGEVTMGTNFHIVIGPESKEEADRFFQALADGGKTTMPMADTFWGAYYGMLTDQFGVQWMINYEQPKAA